MRATLLLCDGVQQLDGKLYVLGWGWAFTGPDPSPQGLAIKVEIGRADYGVPHHLELFLEDQDGHPVVVDQPDGTRQPVEFRNDFEVPLLPDIPDTVSVPIALNFPPLPLGPGARYTWRLSIDGESDELWQATFATRPAPAGAAPAPSAE